MAAEDLHPVRSDEAGRLDALGPGGRRFRTAREPGVHAPGCLVHEKTRAVDGHAHVGDQERQRLMVRDRTTEGLALEGIDS